MPLLTTLAGALIAANVAFSTNIQTLSTSTNLDEIAALTSSSVNTVTNAVHSPEMYTTLSQGGWGYQTIVTPPAARMGLNYTVLPGSLAFHALTNSIVHTNGFGAYAAAESLFTPTIPLNSVIANSNAMSIWTNISSHLTGTLTRNSNCWFSGYPELSAVVVADDADRTSTTNNGGFVEFRIGATAISPRHILCAAHASYSAGTVMVFVDTNNVAFQRTVVSEQDPVDSSSDITCCLLDADLPASITPMKVLPTNYLAWLPTLTNHCEVPLLVINQQLMALPKSWIPFAGIEVSLGQDTYWVSTNWFDTYTTAAGGITGGDSGHPIMVAIGTNLVLVSHFTTAGTGSSIAYFEPQINAAMHSLSVAAGLESNYQLAPIDLSAWPNTTTGLH
jgi:hypothetical protein